MSRLGLADPHLVLLEPERFLEPLDAFLREQTIADEDRPWIHTRIGYFIGELFVCRFEGCWFLNEEDASCHFLRYVVGRFTKLTDKKAIVEPFAVANDYLAQPPGRNLLGSIGQIEREILSPKE